MCKIEQQLANRINQLKLERKNFYDNIENNRCSPIRMNINENTKIFYEHTYNRLIIELENILNKKENDT